MVDMTGANRAGLLRSPEDDERYRALEDQEENSKQAVAAGLLMALSGALVGAGYQWGQWWLVGFALVALALLTVLFKDVRGRWSAARARSDSFAKKSRTTALAGAPPYDVSRDTR